MEKKTTIGYYVMMQSMLAFFMVMAIVMIGLTFLATSSDLWGWFWQRIGGVWQWTRPIPDWAVYIPIAMCGIIIFITGAFMCRQTIVLILVLQRARIERGGRERPAFKEV